MPSTPKVLGQVVPVLGALTPAYTVPGTALGAVVSSIVVCNTSTVEVAFSISVAKDGAADTAAQYLYRSVILPPDDTFVATIGVTLDTNDVVRVVTLGAQAAFNIFGTEITQ